MGVFLKQILLAGRKPDIVRPLSRDVQPDDERVNDLGVESAAAQWLWPGPRHGCLGV